MTNIHEAKAFDCIESHSKNGVSTPEDHGYR
jgi:hypothetical protein